MKSLKKNKKGQLFDQFGQLAVGIAVLAITLTIAFLIMSEGKTQAVETTTSATTLNETRAVTADSFHVVGQCIPDETMSVAEVWNSSTPPTMLIPSSNYTVLNNAINISADGFDLTLNGTPSSINMSYTCKPPSHAYNGTSTLQSATDEVPGWIPLIVVAVIGGLLLGLVALFRRRQ